ncbi:hypothetical protein NUW58_g227 [Xylaria curta]|uniref:Uncharacterized protein n=1 Tax=Xylaria curta TaxID=42375 RepID=A0ACC1PS20_9PEZI|nr:hypothetical protein NUW58_g227 [Xylaria curta]
MKVLLTGASGSIGGGCLTQCLAHPGISTVVAFVRRELPTDLSNHPKLKCVVIKDFSQWPEDVLQAHADAAGMIWAMGSYKGSRTADLEYPLAFLESMARVLKTKPARPRFKYIHLGGMFTRQDQEKKLYFLEYPRKIRNAMTTYGRRSSSGQAGRDRGDDRFADGGRDTWGELVRFA